MAWLTLTPLQTTWAILTTPALFLLRLTLIPVSALVRLLLFILSPVIYIVQYSLAPFYFVLRFLQALQVRRLPPSLPMIPIMGKWQDPVLRSRPYSRSTSS